MSPKRCRKRIVYYTLIRSPIPNRGLNFGYFTQAFVTPKIISVSIHRKSGSIDGRKCYHPIDEIKDDIDVAIFAVPASKVIQIPKAVENVRGAIIVSACFKVMGNAGGFKEELKEIVERKGIRNIGPNCGFLSLQKPCVKV
jgi:acyl-CoA synthetase (NDP forming)